VWSSASRFHVVHWEMLFCITQSSLVIFLLQQQDVFTKKISTSWIFYFFFRPFSLNLRWLWRKISVDQQFLKYSDQPVCFLVPDRLIYAKLLKSLSSPFWSQFGLQQVILTMSLFLNTLNCCPVIGWFAICINIQWVHMNRWIEYWHTDCLCHCLCNAGL